mmetsp:Transcript_11195/g.8738  ORF Transcript_11195/g.8738 Transcript_11195/m.8738 type:complete len:106 (-) Transcript_11195:239-556(-)
MSSGKFAKATEEAKRYVDRHDLERTVNQMVNVVVTAKPKDPKAHMLRWLLENCSAEQQKAVGIRVAKDLPQEASEDRSKEALGHYTAEHEGADPSAQQASSAAEA